MTAIAEIDFTKMAAMGNDLLPRLNHIRETEPIVWNESLAGWLVTRHADVIDGFQGKYPLSCVRSESRSFGTPEAQAQAMARYPLTLSTLPHWITNVDAPVHTRLRVLMTRAFSKRVVEELRGFARTTINEVLDGIAGRPEIEFVDDVARQITGRVILHKFGLSEHYLGRLESWSRSFNKALGAIQPTPELLDMVEEVMTEMQTVFKAEIARRLETPTGDFLSELIGARVAGDRLSEEEVLGICYLTIIAGHDTTLNTMSLGVAALTANPQQRKYLVDHPENILDSVNEIMRFVAMSAAFDRVAAEDFELGGKAIRKGERVWLMIASANRDPRVYDNPDQLDLSRGNLDRSTVFGPGIHHCIGHLLAKMQLCEFFPAFVTRYPDARVLDERLDFQPAVSFRGLNQLRMRLS